MTVAISAWVALGRTERSGEVTTLSEGGCSVRTDLPAAEGAAVRVHVSLPAGGRPLVVDAASVRWARPGFLGIEFHALPDEHRVRLTEFVASVLATQRRETE